MESQSIIARVTPDSSLSRPPLEGRLSGGAHHLRSPRVERPSRFAILCCSVVALLALGAGPALAASITWSTPATITGDSNVSTNGTLVAACNMGGGAVTLNGVPFAAGLGGSGASFTLDSYFTLVNMSHLYSSFGVAAAPFSSLSANYQSLLTDSYYNGTASTITLNNLTLQHQYAVQIWYSDSRSTAIFASAVTGGGNSVTLTCNMSAGAAGGVGQYTIGTFTADAVTQSFTITPTVNTETLLNAIQLRDLGAAPVTHALTPVSVTASSYYSSAQAPINLINGSGMVGGGDILTSTANADGSANGMWHSDGSAVSNTWLIFDLGAQYTLTAADIWNLNQPAYLGRGVKTFRIYTSSTTNRAGLTNYVGLFSLAQGTGANGEPVQRLPLSASGVRLVKFALATDWNNAVDDYVGLAEVRFEGTLTPPPAYTITDGLTGYWKLDESSGSTAADASGKGNTGTVYNSAGDGAQWTTGKVGGALRFRGEGLGNDFVTVPTWSAALTGGLSLSAWARADANQSDALIGAVENAAQAVTAAQDSTALPAATWQHVVLVADGANLLVYRNGGLVASGAYDGTFSNPGTGLVLGASLTGGAGADAYWQGALDEVACWARPLGADEVFMLFAAGADGQPVTAANRYSNSPPVFANPPQGGNYFPHQPFSLLADAAGFGVLTYQWWKDGAPLANGTARLFTNPNAALADSGQYSVVVTDGNGNSATSSPARVTVSNRPVFSGVARLTEGGLQLTGTGAPGQSYVLLAATNLPPSMWQPLATNVASTNGGLTFSDSQATNYDHRFYRLQAQ